MVKIRLSENVEVVVDEALAEVQEAFAQALRHQQPLVFTDAHRGDLVINPQHVLYFEVANTAPNGNGHGAIRSVDPVPEDLPPAYRH